MTISTLPRIIQFCGMHDSGPTDGGRDCSICPHCGAKGRYTYFFKTDDGTSNTYGAMSGCLKLFAVSPVATTHQKLLKKQNELQRKYGRDAKLNSWMTKQLEAIEKFYAGEIDEMSAIREIDRQALSMGQYRAKKYR